MGAAAYLLVLGPCRRKGREGRSEERRVKGGNESANDQGAARTIGWVHGPRGEDFSLSTKLALFAERPASLAISGRPKAKLIWAVVIRPSAGRSVIRSRIERRRSQKWRQRRVRTGWPGAGFKNPAGTRQASKKLAAGREKDQAVIYQSSLACGCTGICGVTLFHRIVSCSCRNPAIKDRVLFDPDAGAVHSRSGDRACRRARSSMQ